MTGSEAKELIIKNAMPYFEEKGWKLKKVKWNEAKIINKQDGFTDFIGISTTDYNPEQLIGFGMGKRIEAVEKIIQEIDKVIPFTNPPIRKDEPTLYLMDKKEFIQKEDRSYCSSEADIIYNLNKIFNYLDNHALPLLEKFNDLREIDRRINGDGDNFWHDTDKKPFNLAHKFYLRRLIIARLSGRADYNDFIESYLQRIEKASIEANEHFDRNDLTDELVYCIHLLKDVTPHY